MKRVGVTEGFRERVRERLVAEYRNALRAGREQTETAIIGWCSGLLIAGSLVVMLFSPSAGHWMFATGVVGAVLAVRRDLMHLWKAWWKKHGSE